MTSTNHRRNRTTKLRVVTTRYSFSVVYETAPEYPAGTTVPSVAKAATIARHAPHPHCRESRR